MAGFAPSARFWNSFHARVVVDPSMVLLPALRTFRDRYGPPFVLDPKIMSTHSQLAYLDLALEEKSNAVAETDINGELRTLRQQLQESICYRAYFGCTRCRNGRIRVFVCLLMLCAIFWYHQQRDTPVALSADVAGFHPVALTSFVNSAEQDVAQCEDIQFNSSIGMQPSLHVANDLQAIAAELDGHPIVDYNNQKGMSLEQARAQTWTGTMQSSAWLSRFEVYLTVTRIIFADDRNPSMGRISWLRGQIHDAHWNELKNYTLEWEGQLVTFPKTFDIKAPYTLGGLWFGPEDPRIIAYEEPDGAMQEPVVVFNMYDSGEDPKLRRMYIFRPFSSRLAMLTITGRAPNEVEKNWSPFLYRSNVDRTNGKYNYIHFVYGISVLQILKCHLGNGQCRFVYVQDLTQTIGAPAGDPSGAFRGGTNLMAVSVRRGVQSFVGFPRTHVSHACNGFYRPELMVLSASSPTYFYIEMVSTPLSFDDAVLEYGNEGNPCGKGRIVMPNSLARWQESDGSDIMTISFSMDDRTTQVVRLQGVWQYIKSAIQPQLEMQSRIFNAKVSAHPEEAWSAAAQQVLGCASEVAINDTLDQISRVTQGHAQLVAVLKQDSPQLVDSQAQKDPKPAVVPSQEVAQVVASTVQENAEPAARSIQEDGTDQE